MQQEALTPATERPTPGRVSGVSREGVCTEPPEQALGEGWTGTHHKTTWTGSGLPVSAHCQCLAQQGTQVGWEAPPLLQAGWGDLGTSQGTVFQVEREDTLDLGCKVPEGLLTQPLNFSILHIPLIYSLNTCLSRAHKCQMQGWTLDYLAIK